MTLTKVWICGLMVLWCLLSICHANDTAHHSQTTHTNTHTQKLNFSPLFVLLSDAMGAVKGNDVDKAKADLLIMEQQLSQLSQNTSRQSPLLAELQQALMLAKANPTDDTLRVLSIKLYAYEKEQNPIDYGDKRRQFAKRITPVLAELDATIQTYQAGADTTALKVSYERFNKTWVANERVVRNTSMAHYGKIETAIAMIRVGIENTPPNLAMIKDNMASLKSTIDNYNAGGQLTDIKNEQVDLAYGIALLQKGLTALHNNDQQSAQQHLGRFIQIWATIEGEVRTRDATLYADIESQIPVIMAKGDSDSQKALMALTARLQHINPNARYLWVDAMLILLREGLEALLIVIALLTAMKVAGQHKGKTWIYAGVMTGLVASVLGAMALQRLFPAMTSGANREALEGMVGIVAVVMMMGVGVWLHSKSSTKAWSAYIDKHMGKALSTGSMAGLFGLAFLSVFREGAETILFYVGILPSITFGEFVVGIVVAVLLLMVVAIVMTKTSVKLPIPLLFKLLTGLIYALGFKMLGVSISALQLTGHLPRDVLDLPAVPLLGIYPSVQGLAVQGVYGLVVIVSLLMARRAS